MQAVIYALATKINKYNYKFLVRDFQTWASQVVLSQVEI